MFLLFAFVPEKRDWKNYSRKSFNLAFKCAEKIDLWQYQTEHFYLKRQTFKGSLKYFCWEDVVTSTDQKLIKFLYLGKVRRNNLSYEET